MLDRLDDNLLDFAIVGGGYDIEYLFILTWNIVQKRDGAPGIVVYCIV